jgi:hypothetical protein
MGNKQGRTFTNSFGYFSPQITSNGMKKTFFQGPIRKNVLTLWAKYYVDEILGRNAFVHSGTKISTILPTPIDKPLTILFPTAYYLDRGLAWQSTIAKAFSARGHKVIFMPLDLHFPRRNALYADDQDWGFLPGSIIYIPIPYCVDFVFLFNHTVHSGQRIRFLSTALKSNIVRMRIAYRMCMIISHTENCVKIP